MVCRVGMRRLVTLSQGVGATGLAPLLAEIRAMLAGGASPQWAFVGDSTTAGAYAGTGGVYDRAKSYPSAVAAALAAAGIPAEDDSLWGTAGFQATPAYFSGVTIGAGWTASGVPNQGLGGPSWLCASGTAAFAITPRQEETDTFDVWYPNNAAYPAFTISDGAGHSKTVTPAGSGVGLALASLGPADGVVRGANTFSITRISGTARFVATHIYDSLTPKVAVHNMGWGGSKVANWTVTTYDWSTRNALKLLPFTAVFFNLGINDWNSSAPTDVATFQAGIDTLVTDQTSLSRATGIIVPVPSNISYQSEAGQEPYRAALRSVAASRASYLTDMPRKTGWATWVEANGLGRMYDNAHPTETGYASMGQAVASPILAALT